MEDIRRLQRPRDDGDNKSKSVKTRIRKFGKWFGEYCASKRIALTHPSQGTLSKCRYSQICLMVPWFCPPNIEPIMGLNDYPIVIY